MILVEDVHKRYLTTHGPGKWVLQGVSFTIPPKTNVGLIGGNGAGKSTLLRIIGGVDRPTRGRIERHCRVSWPMGFGGGLQGSLTGRQNSKFICRIHGHDNDIPKHMAAIQAFAEIGDAFDEPVKTYSSGMAARLKFAISLAFDFDIYISDELTAVGDAVFQKKAKQAFQNLVNRAGLIMVSHQEGVLKDFCQAGIWLDEGRAHWFDNIDDAIRAYRESQAVGLPSQQARPAIDDLLTAKLVQMAGVRWAMNILQKGLQGNPETLEFQPAGGVIRSAEKFGLNLLSGEELMSRGYQPKVDCVPLLRRKSQDGTNRIIDLYDLQTQCVNVD